MSEKEELFERIKIIIDRKKANNQSPLLATTLEFSLMSSERAILKELVKEGRIVVGNCINCGYAAIKGEKLL